MAVLGYLLLALLVIAVVLALVAVYVLAIVYVAIPVLLVAATVGILVGGANGLIGALRGLSGRETDGMPETAPEPGRRRRPSAPYPLRDGAWPHYLADQVLRDVVNTTRLPAKHVRLLYDMLREGAGWLMDADRWMLLLAPLLLAFPVYVAGVAAATAATLVAVAAAVTPVAIAGWAVGLTAVAILRPVDYLVRWRRGAAAVCTGCNRVTALPAYACGTCTVQHRDVRPGLLGLWFRRCACGSRWPTTVLRSSRVLDAVCPHCDAILPEFAGIYPDIRIAVSGAPQSGKTALLDAGLAEMRARAVAAGHTWEVVAAEAPHAGTPRPIAVRTVRHLRPAYLHLFDPPGDLFVEEAPGGALHHLGTTRYHLLVLDPLRIARVGDAGPDQVDRPYRLMVEEIRHHGMNPRRCSLAVAVAKMDLIWSRPDADLLALTGDRPPRPREWLLRMGLDNLVVAADRDFAKVRYFFHGPPPEDRFRHLPRDFGTPSAPIRWLLRQRHLGMGLR